MILRLLATQRRSTRMPPSGAVSSEAAARAVARAVARAARAMAPDMALAPERAARAAREATPPLVPPAPGATLRNCLHSLVGVHVPYPTPTQSEAYMHMLENVPVVSALHLDLLPSCLELCINSSFCIRAE